MKSELCFLRDSRSSRSVPQRLKVEFRHHRPQEVNFTFAAVALHFVEVLLITQLIFHSCCLAARLPTARLPPEIHGQRCLCSITFAWEYEPVKLLYLDLLILLDRPAVIGFHRMNLVCREFDSGPTRQHHFLGSRVPSILFLLYALDQFRFMNDLTALINGVPLCPERFRLQDPSG